MYLLSFNIFWTILPVTMCNRFHNILTYSETRGTNSYTRSCLCVNFSFNNRVHIWFILLTVVEYYNSKSDKLKFYHIWFRLFYWTYLMLSPCSVHLLLIYLDSSWTVFMTLISFHHNIKYQLFCDMLCCLNIPQFSETQTITSITTYVKGVETLTYFSIL